MRSRLGFRRPQLLAIIWGAAIGLAHWFSFRLVARGFSGYRPTRLDARIGPAQVGGAAFVAGASSLPVIIFSDSARQQHVIGYVPAVFIGVIGVIGYLVARATGRSSTSRLRAPQRQQRRRRPRPTHALEPTRPMDLVTRTHPRRPRRPGRLATRTSNDNHAGTRVAALRGHLPAARARVLRDMQAADDPPTPRPPP